jgi:hypothetical protein
MTAARNTRQHHVSIIHASAHLSCVDDSGLVTILVDYDAPKSSCNPNTPRVLAVARTTAPLRITARIGNTARRAQRDRPPDIRLQPAGPRQLAEQGGVTRQVQRPALVGVDAVADAEPIAMAPRYGAGGAAKAGLNLSAYRLADARGVR